MPILKCKMCGGSLEIAENSAIVECEYCGSTQTLPKLDNEKRLSLFDRANYYRLNNEFDKASVIYENVISEEPNDAEAHWGICLCRYGIEYVEDPKTKKRIPTCHRTQFKSILEDSDYLAAIDNADILAKEIYQNEAQYIDTVQKNILAISSKEEPFDIFICYKETDKDGERTIDSVIAQEIYTELTKENYKVFFARITLEDKIGTAYEPYIFAALNSAKVMLVVGTKQEHFNAVWVKNEWSRYLSFIEQGQDKALVPCYRDMDAYDLPEEFVALQGQDVSKVGWKQDLIRGIKKIVSKDDNNKISNDRINFNTANTASPILKRVFLCLEDRDFEKANSLIEQVFNLDPECAEAYIAKLMIDKKLSSKDSLYSLDTDLKDEPLYIRALRFADDGYKAVLEEYRNESIYRKACGYLEQNTIEKYNAAKPLFDKIINYKDAKSKRESCDAGVVEINYQGACRLKREANNFSDTQRASSAAEEFRKLGDYKDSKTQVDECIELGKLIQYKKAVEAKERAASCKDAESVNKFYNNAISIFSSLGEYKDSSEQKTECEQLKNEALYLIASSIKDSADKTNDASAYNTAASIFSQISHYKDSAEQEVECVGKAQAANTDATYRKAVELSNKEDIQSLNTAINMFNSISSWKDSAELSQKCKDKIETINSDIARQNKIDSLQTEWKELFFNEKSLLTLKQDNNSIERTKLRRRVFILIYLICVVIATVFAADKNELLSEGISFAGYLNILVFENKPLLICMIVAAVSALFTTSSVFLWYVNAIGVVISPLGIILNLIRLFSPISNKDKKICKQWKQTKTELSTTQKRIKEVENELNTLIGVEKVNHFKTVFTSSAVTNQNNIVKKKLSIVPRIIYLIIIGLISFLIFLFNFILPNSKYEKAVSMMENGDYQSAYTTFEELKGFEDSSDKLIEIRKIFAADHIKKIQQSKIGETVIFGTYEQDEDTSNGQENLEWIVLAKDNNKALLITKLVIDGGPFDETGSNTTWATCSLRKRMNGEMLSTAFTDAEQDYILSTKVKASHNTELNVNGGEDSQDKLFLLSCEEIEKYFTTEEKRIAEITDYGNYKTGTNSYWLRTPYYEGYMTQILWSGRYNENKVDYAPMGIRPAMWVDIS